MDKQELSNGTDEVLVNDTDAPQVQSTFMDDLQQWLDEKTLHPDYGLKPYGTVWYRPSSDSDKAPIEVRIANRPCWPIGEYYDKGRYQNYYLNVGYLDKHYKERMVSIKHADIISNPRAAYAKLASHGVMITSKKQFTEYLIDSMATSPIPVTNQFGFDPDTAAFLLPSQTITPSWLSDTVPELSDRMKTVERVIHAQGSYAQWKEAIANAQTPFVHFALCVGLTSPLSQLIRSESIGVHFYGLSSKGKTNALRVLVSLWAKPGPTGEGYIDTWSTTTSAIENLCTDRNGLVLVLDEIGRNANKEFESFAYTIQDGRGKSRMSSSLERVEENQWFVNMVSSGEASTVDITKRTGGEVFTGAEIRIMNMAIDGFESRSEASLTTSEADALRNAVESNYGFAGPDFVHQLLESVSSQEELKALIAHYHSEISADLEPMFNAGNAVKRALPKFALIQAAGELAVEFGVLPLSIEQVREAVRIAIETWLECLEAPSDVERAINKLRSAVINGSHRIIQLDSATPASFPEPVCYRNDQYFFFTDEQISAVVGHISPKQVARVMKEKGWLHTNERDRQKVKKTLPNLGEMRVYAVRKGFIEDEQRPPSRSCLITRSNAADQ